MSVSGAATALAVVGALWVVRTPERPQAEHAEERVLPARIAEPTAAATTRSSVTAPKDLVPQDVVRDASDLRAMSSRANNVLRHCWDAVRKKEPPGRPLSSGRLTATVTVLPTGRVGSVVVSGAEGQSPSLGPCIADGIRGLTFSTASDPVTFKVSVALSADEPAREE